MTRWKRCKVIKELSILLMIVFHKFHHGLQPTYHRINILNVLSIQEIFSFSFRKSFVDATRNSENAMYSFSSHGLDNLLSELPHGDSFNGKVLVLDCHGNHVPFFNRSINAK